MKRAFLICPVRGADQSLAETWVKSLEDDGWSVHWPPRDTNQDDATGLRIRRDNEAAIRAADRVFFIWDGKSQGCLFDFGMAFAMGKSVSSLSLPPETEGKSFQNMVRALELAAGERPLHSATTPSTTRCDTAQSTAQRASKATSTEGE